MVATLAAGLTATSIAGNGWTCDLATLACARSDAFAVGATSTINVKVNVAASLAGNIVSSFTVSGRGDLNYSNNYAADTGFVRNFTLTLLSASPNPMPLLGIP